MCYNYIVIPILLLHFHNFLIAANSWNFLCPICCTVAFLAKRETQTLTWVLYTGNSAPRIFRLRSNQENSNTGDFWCKVYRLSPSDNDGWEECYWCLYEGLQKSTRKFVIQSIFGIRDFRENFSFFTSLGAELPV